MLLSSLRPLWTDEVLQLAIASHPVGHSFFDEVRLNAGGTPLGYLVAAASEREFGPTWMGARLPSILAGAAAVLSVLALAEELGAATPLFACLLFAICPLQIRYAAEGRPYEIALLFSILSSLYALRLNRVPSPANSAIYAALVTVGIYCQPFAAFIAIGHGLWMAWQALRTRRWESWIYWAAAFAVALTLFIPWYLYASPAWQVERVRYTPSLALVLIREISGDGYWCSIPLIAAAAVGLRKTPALILSTTVAALLGPLVADAEFGYFFAIRQFLFALPGLVLAASVGLVEIKKRSTVAAAVLALTFGAGAVGKLFSYFGDRSENFATAASYLAAHSANTCIVSFPPGYVSLYALFAPDLSGRDCSDKLNVAQRIFVLPPHTPDLLHQQFQRESKGMRVDSVGGSLIAAPELPPRR